MHRGCGRPVRTLRTFCDDRAAPTAPALYFLCAKEMTGTVITGTSQVPVPVVVMAVVAAVVVVAVTTTLPSATP